MQAPRSWRARDASGSPAAPAAARGGRRQGEGGAGALRVAGLNSPPDVTPYRGDRDAKHGMLVG